MSIFFSRTLPTTPHNIQDSINSHDLFDCITFIRFDRPLFLSRSRINLHLLLTYICHLRWNSKLSFLPACLRETEAMTRAKTTRIISDNTSKSSNIYYDKIYRYLIQHMKKKEIQKYLQNMSCACCVCVSRQFGRE